MSWLVGGDGSGAREGQDLALQELKMQWQSKLSECKRKICERLDEAKDGQRGIRRVGLIAFNQGIAKHVAFTEDFGAVREAIEGLEPSGLTALYDTVGLALNELERSRDDPRTVGQLLVLTDGI